jgi:hypothetical protein
MLELYLAVYQRISNIYDGNINCIKSCKILKALVEDRNANYNNEFVFQLELSTSQIGSSGIDLLTIHFNQHPIIDHY